MTTPTATAYQKALVISPKITGLMSVIGSSCILIDIVRRKWRKSHGSSSKNQRRRKTNHRNNTTIITPRHRLLFGLSCCDIMCSISMSLTTWPIPSSGNDTPSGNRLWNVGTTATCTAQGFFQQMGLIGALFYQMFLALYYVLVIRQRYTNTQISSKWYIEPIWHFIALTAGFATSITGIFLDLYNPLPHHWCWIAPLPLDCTQSYTIDDPTQKTNCFRGDNARLYQLWFWNYPLMFVLIFIILSMVAIYMKLKHVHNNAPKIQLSSRTRNSRRSGCGRSGSESGSGRGSGRSSSRTASGGGSASDTNLKHFALQAIFYVLGFIICYGPFISLMLYMKIQQLPKGPIAWSFVAATLIPLQGFFNALVYFVLPKILRKYFSFSFSSSSSSKQQQQQDESYALSLHLKKYHCGGGGGGGGSSNTTAVAGSSSDNINMVVVDDAEVSPFGYCSHRTSSTDATSCNIHQLNNQLDTTADIAESSDNMVVVDEVSPFGYSSHRTSSTEASNSNNIHPNNQQLDDLSSFHPSRGENHNRKQNHHDHQGSDHHCSSCTTAKEEGGGERGKGCRACGGLDDAVRENNEEEDGACFSSGISSSIRVDDEEEEEIVFYSDDDDKADDDESK